MKPLCIPACLLGAIVVTSRPGMTKFAILLPLLREPASQPQASPV
jgi:nitrogen-specific signal transduction histidine kinase